MFHSIVFCKMLLIFLIIELLTICIGSAAANSLINHNGGGVSSSQSSAPSLSDLNHQQTNTNSIQYSMNKDDEQQNTKSTQSQIQMDENDALRILLQNYKLNADYQYNQQQQYHHQSILNPWLRNNDEFLRSTANAGNTRIIPSAATVAYIQPIYIPYPVLINPSSQNLPSYISSGGITSSTNFIGDYEDVMSRGNINRRGGGNSVGVNNGGGIIDNNGNFRNSPIYYVRLPPTPYAFLPSIGGYTSAHNNFATSQFNPFIQLNTPIRSYPISTYQHNQSPPPTLSSILNLPVNFLANGKPTNVYNLDSSHELPSITYQRPSYQQLQQNRPINNNNGKPIQTNFIRQPSANNFANLDSKITNLKRQYLFNGRPDDEIYLLPNEFDRWNTNYQNSIPEYY